VLVKASAVIKQVDANTLKVVATFPSQIEAERQTGIPRSNISRGLRRGRPPGGTFGGLYGYKASDYSKSTSFRYTNFVYLQLRYSVLIASGSSSPTSPQHHMRERVFRDASWATFNAAANFTTEFLSIMPLTRTSTETVSRHEQSFRLASFYKSRVVWVRIFQSLLCCFPTFVSQL
jgi:hypothetical protein